jgi:hypothetical protein
VSDSAACGWPTEVVAVATVSVRLVSVAVRTHVPVPVYEMLLKTAAPAAADSVAVPPIPQGELRTIVSVEPVTVESMLP